MWMNILIVRNGLEKEDVAVYPLSWNIRAGWTKTICFVPKEKFCCLQLVMGTVFENDSKNNVLSNFLFFQNWKRNALFQSRRFGLKTQ